MNQNQRGCLPRRRWQNQPGPKVPFYPTLAVSAGKPGQKGFPNRYNIPVVVLVSLATSLLSMNGLESYCGASFARPGKLLRHLICEDERLEARHTGEGERGTSGGHMSQVSHVAGEPCQPRGAPQHDQAIEAHVQHQTPTPAAR